MYLNQGKVERRSLFRTEKVIEMLKTHTTGNDALPMSDLIAHLNEAHKDERPFTVEEVEAVLAPLQEQNRFMVADGIIIRI
jgi:hypothetical protein